AAVNGTEFGSQRPNWFAPAQDQPQDIASFDGKPNWFDAVGEEHRAIRERVALIDQTSFAKFEVSGAGAFDAMQKIAANDLSGGWSRAVYTQLCNDKGGIEADVTVLSMAPDLLY